MTQYNWNNFTPAQWDDFTIDEWSIFLLDAASGSTMGGEVDSISVVSAPVLGASKGVGGAINGKWTTSCDLLIETTLAGDISSASAISGRVIFLADEVWLSGGIDGHGTIEGSMFVHRTEFLAGLINGVTAISGEVTLMGVPTNTITLYINSGPIKRAENMTLFIKQGASGITNIDGPELFPLLITGNGSTDGYLPFNQGITLYINRASEYKQEILTLHTLGDGDITKTRTMFVNGANVSGVGMTLVVPSSIDSRADGFSLYTNGY
jgi:hypothetical protein